MQPYPHTYHASAKAAHIGSVTVAGTDLPDIETNPPPEFDGPPGFWSPETLLCAAIADCFILTFRGVSRAARFEWLTLECQVESSLERLNGVSQFTRHAVRATLKVDAGTDAARARSLLERAEQSCLVSNSLRGARTLELQVDTA